MLIDKILKAANIIAKKSREPNGNYIIVSSNVANMMNGLIFEKNNKRMEKIKKIFKNDH